MEWKAKILERIRQLRGCETFAVDELFGVDEERGEQLFELFEEKRKQCSRYTELLEALVEKCETVEEVCLVVFWVGHFCGWNEACDTALEKVGRIVQRLIGG